MMTATSPRYRVEGGSALRGSVRTSGSKNAALAAMCASLLTDEDIILENVPDISVSLLLQTITLNNHKFQLLCPLSI